MIINLYEFLEIEWKFKSVTKNWMEYYKKFKKIKSVAYSSQGSHTGQLDFCNWLADSSTTG